jgi:serine/threonine protein kinase
MPHGPFQEDGCPRAVRLSAFAQLERKLAPHALVPLAPVRRRHFSLVFPARQVETGRALFVKLLLSQAPGVRRNFDREIEILRELGGKPGVTRLVVSSTDPALVFHACETVCGRSLPDIARSPEGRDLACVLEHVRSLARWITALHGMGIVHRDLSPEHVFIQRDGLPVVIDFGMARRTRELSAEDRIRYEGYDLQALGMILWEMICGHPVFPYRDPALSVVLRREAALVREASLPAAVRRWLLDCFAVPSELTSDQRFFLR